MSLCVFIDFMFVLFLYSIYIIALYEANNFKIKIELKKGAKIRPSVVEFIYFYVYTQQTTVRKINIHIPKQNRRNKKNIF